MSSYLSPRSGAFFFGADCPRSASACFCGILHLLGKWGACPLYRHGWPAGAPTPRAAAASCSGVICSLGNIAAEVRVKPCQPLLFRDALCILPCSNDLRLRVHFAANIRVMPGRAQFIIRYPVKELRVPGQFKAVGGCAVRHELFHGLLAVGHLLCPVRLGDLAPHRPENIGKPPGGQLTLSPIRQSCAGKYPRLPAVISSFHSYKMVSPCCLS